VHQLGDNAEVAALEGSGRPLVVDSTFEVHVTDTGRSFRALDPGQHRLAVAAAAGIARDDQIVKDSRGAGPTLMEGQLSKAA
jgi:hypothetical protein